MSPPKSDNPNLAGQRPAQSSQRRQLSRSWLIGSLVLLTVAAPALYFWHARQVGRVADALSAEADRCLADDDPAQAAKYLYRLVQLQANHPERSETLVRLAQTYDQSVTRLGEKPAVIQWYYQAIGAAPDRLDLQLRLAELFLETRQFVLAAEQADRVLAQDPGQLHAKKLKALARYGQLQQGRPIAVAEVRRELEEVQQQEPGDLAIARALTDLYRGTPETDTNSTANKADSVMDALVQGASDDYRAHMARFQYRRQNGDPTAEADLREALRLAPEEPDVLLAAAQLAWERDAREEAGGFYRRVIEAHPEDPRAYLSWGDCLYQSGDVERATRTWQLGREKATSMRLSMSLRRTGALIQLNRLDEAEQELQIVDEELRRLSTGRDRTQRDAIGASRHLLAARLALARQQVEPAIELLERVATTAKQMTGERPEESAAFQARILLGRIGLRQNQWEAALKNFQQALQLAPQSSTARVGAAQALLALGRDTEALAVGDFLMDEGNAPPDLWPVLAQLRLDRQLQLPPSDRQWETLEQTLQQARTTAPDAWEISIAQAQVRLARGGEDVLEEVVRMLHDMEQSHPDVLPMWLNLVFLYENLGSPSDADRALQRVQSLADDPLQAKAWQIVLLGMRSQFAEAERLLTDQQTKTENGSLWLLRAQLVIAYQKGVTRDIRAALMDLLEAQPENPEWLAQLAELALQQDKGVEADRWISRLRELEGPTGVLWKFYQTRRLAIRIRSTDSPDMARIRQFVAEIRQVRPTWAGLAWLEGIVAELEGQPDVAIESLTRAIRGGFRQAELWQRLVTLLHRQGRVAEADQWLLQLKQPNLLGAVAEISSWESALQSQRLAWAIDRAREEVSVRPFDAAAQVWLARLLLLDGQPSSAAEALRRAWDLKPQDVSTLIAMLGCYVQIRDATAARTVLEQLARHPDLSTLDRQLLLARAHHALGDREQTNQFYEAAIGLAPDRPELCVEYARVLQPLEAERAEEMLRDVLRDHPGQADARRLLATWLLWRIDPAARQESLSLLRRDPDSQQQQASDQRLQAVLLLRQGLTDDVQEARQLLEETVRDPDQATLDDHWLLASLYEREGRLGEAEEQLRLLVDQPQPQSRHLVAWIEFLLRHGRLDEANRQWMQLEQSGQRSFTTLALRARILQAQDHPQQLEQELEGYAEQWLGEPRSASDQRRFMGQLAELYAAIDRPDLGRRWYQQLVDAFPQDREAFALFLIRQSDFQQAIQICLEPLQQEPTPEAAAQLARVLVQIPGAVKMPPSVASLLEQQLEEHPQHSALLFAMSNWQLKNGQVGRAIELLEQLTAIDPRHYLAWNNLAALLAEDSDRLPEALIAIDRAIAAAGQPLPNLLDTKAVILLHQQRDQEAASLLMQAFSLAPADDSRFFLHFAVALERLGMSQRAAELWKTAQQLGLNRAFLTDFERDLVQDLKEKLGVPSADAGQKPEQDDDREGQATPASRPPSASRALVARPILLATNYVANEGEVDWSIRGNRVSL